MIVDITQHPAPITNTYHPVHLWSPMKPGLSLLLAGASLALWIVLAFVKPIPSGWVHLPLAAAAALIAVAIIESGPARN